MLVYKCPVCGAVYTKNKVPQDEMCVSCDSYLKVVNIKEDKGNTHKPVIQDDSRVGRQTSVGRVRNVLADERELKKNDVPITEIVSKGSTQSVEPKQTDFQYIDSNRNEENNNYIEGTVISAVSDAGYRRLPWERLVDRYFYSQNVNDMQNSIYVRCVDSNGVVTNRTIIKYGQIKGGAGIFRTGMKIRAYGKTNGKNEFVAKSIVLENQINVSTRTEVGDVLYCLSPLLLGLVCFLVINITSVFKGILSSQYIKWYFLCLIGTYIVSFLAIGRVVRLPIINKIRTCTWISIIAGSILFFVCKGIFFV